MVKIEHTNLAEIGKIAESRSGVTPQSRRLRLSFSAPQPPGQPEHLLQLTGGLVKAAYPGNFAAPHTFAFIGAVKAVMKIAQVAPLIESVPPRLYGGTERIVSYLTEELVRLGHDVTLFASGRLYHQRRVGSLLYSRAPPRSYRARHHSALHADDR